MNTKSKEELIAIIEKQEMYIEHLEIVARDIFETAENWIIGNEGRTLKGEIEELKK